MKVSKSVVPGAERHGVKLAVAEDQGLEGQCGCGTLAQGRPARRDDSSAGPRARRGSGRRERAALARSGAKGKCDVSPRVQVGGRRRQMENDAACGDDDVDTEFEQSVA